MGDVPAYLRDGQPGAHTYGTLSYNRRAKCWTIKGEPCVTELAKRLFPGCDGRGRGVARFTAHRRIVGELNWLMLRYPLEIRESDRARWEQALEDAREYAVRREQARLAPESAEPPEGSFAGELLPFQKQGLAFLLSSRRCLLADEMGLGQDGAGAGVFGGVGGVSGGDRRAAAPDPQLVARDRALSARAGARRSRTDAVSAAGGGRLPRPLPAAARLEGRAARAGTAHGHLRRDSGIAPQRHGQVQAPQACFRNRAKTPSDCRARRSTIRGGEIWNVVNILDFHFLGDWESFSREWCYGYNSAVVAKPELLGDHLKREGLMLRRLKADVLAELAPKRRLCAGDRLGRRALPRTDEAGGAAAGPAARHRRSRPAGADRGCHLPARAAGDRSGEGRRSSAPLCARCSTAARRCC